MLLTKFFQFIKGYVILKLSGNNIEKDLEKIRKSGAVPRNIKPVEDGVILTVDQRDCRLLDGVEYSRIAGFGGAFFLEKVKRHPVLLAGLVMGFIVLFLGSGFIWTVEYDGVSQENIQMVESAAKLAGIKVGMPKAKLDEPLEIKNTILAHTDGISWCWVYIKGTRAIVSVRENILPPQIVDPDTPCNIVAAKDAVVTEIITKRGTCVAENNRMVSCGELLISGNVRFGDGSGYDVHASGICKGKTTYEREGIYKLYLNHKKYTGRKRNFFKLKIFSFELPLYKNAESDFKFYDTMEKKYEISMGYENYIGIGLEKISHIEYNIIREPIQREVLVEFAKNEMEADIAGELLPGALKLSEDVACSVIDEETVSVKLTMEFEEQIGAENFIEEVTIFEPKTD
ncbi:MAG: hypothetical protein E7417_00525 [Ruminococcaceae bacterium]|nr:hypothetical protein [Oscillospiraceae bacterium]